jgi:hypothetical protein
VQVDWTVFQTPPAPACKTLWATYKKTIGMKKILVLFSTILTLVANGQTSYYSFPDSNAVWNIETYYQCWGGVPGPVYQFYSITFSGDTLISSQTYHKLTAPFVETYASGCSGGGIVLDVYKGAIRQDSTNRKVFFVPPSNNIEELLYDFNMQVGDTVKGYLETFASPVDTVESIDSVLVGSTYRKRWNINLGYDIHLIEGIGSTFGLVERSPGNGPDWAAYSITCFQQDGQPLYPETASTCELITSINSKDKFLNQINVFPNPSEGSLTIDFGETNIKEVQLTDILGNILLHRVLNAQTNFEIKELKGGTYILTLIDTDNRRINRKIISSP